MASKKETKRQLTNEEKEDLYKLIYETGKDLTYNGNTTDDVFENVFLNIKYMLSEQLERCFIYPSKISILKKKIQQEYIKCRLQPGEAVGITAATSIVAPYTQNTLSSFHYAGVMNIIKTLGLPLFNELTRVTANPKNPSMTVYYRQNYEKEITVKLNSPIVVCELHALSGIVNIINEQEFKKITVKNNFVSTLGIINCNREIEKEEWDTKNDEIVIVLKKPVKSVQIKFIGYNYNMKFTKKLLNVKFKDLVLSTDVELITDKTVYDSWYKTYNKLYGKEYLRTDEDDCQLYNIRCRFQINRELLIKYDITLEFIWRKLEYQYETLYFACSSMKECIIDLYLSTSLSKKLIPTMKEQDHVTEKTYLYYLVKFALSELFERDILGIPSIKKVVPCKKKIDDETIYTLETEGSSLLEVLGMEEFDNRKTTTNHLVEIFEVLGIEAGKMFLYNELVQSANGGSYINPIHLNLLESAMSFTGKFKPISRFGVLKNQVGPLGRATFECPIANIVAGASRMEKESTSGISASVSLGKLPKIGTGLCDVYYKD